MASLSRLLRRVAGGGSSSTAEIMKRTEVFIISYPKSGRTWLRFMIGKALCLAYGHPDDRITELSELTRDIKRRQDPRIRVAEFAHDGLVEAIELPYTVLFRPRPEFAGKHVVLLVRDPKDVVVSYYFHSTRRFDAYSGTLSSFVRDERLGVRKLLAFNKNWYDNRDIPESFTVITYEEMHDDPAALIRRVLGVIGVTHVDEAVVEEAVRYGRFDHMRELELDDRFQKGLLRPRDRDDPESFKVRKGEVGGYREYLNDDDIAYIDECARAMQYPL